MTNRSDAADSALEHTPLHALHLELGAKMAPFAGYTMPINYPLGILQEHLHTRAKAGLFDVSHMGQVALRGADAAAALESLVPVDVVGLGPGRQRYAMFTAGDGGILDDFMVANAGDHLFLVVNAACKKQDLAHLQAGVGERCRVEPLDGRGLLALQGPAAARVLGRLAPQAEALVFMSAADIDIDGAPCFVTRSGYTGEDGFEISVPGDRAEALARRMLDDEDVEMVGLGARDSLRLEAGLCLYGHDIDTSTSPVEAGLGWALSKARRAGGARPGGYPGDAVIMGQLAQGTDRRLVGLRPEGRAPVRDGAEIVDHAGATIGAVTSGGFGPTVGGPIAMGYVPTGFAKPGTVVSAMVRGKALPVRVATMPFVEHRYHRG
jgi:aminomethyltransferase